MFMTLEDLAVIYPALRRYVSQGFTLCRPVLSLEIEIEIETCNQRLTVNAENSSVRQTSEIPAFG